MRSLLCSTRAANRLCPLPPLPAPICPPRFRAHPRASVLAEERRVRIDIVGSACCTSPGTALRNSRPVLERGLEGLVDPPVLQRLHVEADQEVPSGPQDPHEAVVHVRDPEIPVVPEDPHRRSLENDPVLFPFRAPAPSARIFAGRVDAPFESSGITGRSCSRPAPAPVSRPSNMQIPSRPVPSLHGLATTRPFRKVIGRSAGII